MAQKPRIEYVSRYYTYGSEARKLETAPKFQLPKLPEVKLERFQKIYIDPIGLAGIALAVVLLTVLVLGAFHMRDTRAEYDAVRTCLSELRRENAQLSHTYHTSYDLNKIHEQAKKIGMIEGEDAERFTIFFSIPEPQKEPSAWDNFVWFLSGLLSNPKRAGA